MNVTLNILPMNYDFYSNWHLIQPHLKKPLLIEAINKGIRSYRGDGWSMEDGPPSSMGYLADNPDVREREREEFMKDNPDKIPQEYKDLEAQQDRLHPDDIDDDQEQWFELQSQKECIIDDLIPVPSEDEYGYYVMSGACHWWNPTFSLTLAGLMFPDEQWEVLSSNVHTTVVNKEKSRVFDILYYEHQCPGDVTLGGIKAIHDATPGNWTNTRGKLVQTN